MITREDGFSWVAPRISREGFMLQCQGTPVTDEEASRAYDALNDGWHVDPLFALAIWQQESTKSTNPQSVNVRYGNHNPGNIRNPPPAGPQVQTDRGPFLTFDNWTDGFAAMGEHLASGLYKGLTIWDAIHKWAPAGDGNNPDAYTANVLAYMNANTDVEKGGTMARVVLSAGHMNIGSIGPEKGVDAGSLSRQTGSLGTEAQPNNEVVQAAAQLLSKAGVDVVTTDAIYHEDVYGQSADLIVFVHHDGVGFGNDRPQWSGACAVQSGNPSQDANAVAQRFVDAWNELSPGITGITDLRLSENPTVDMTGYYGGWYRTSDSPAALVECSIWGGSDGQRPDVDTGREGHALAAAIAAALNVGGATDVPRSDPGTTDSGTGDPGGDPGSGPVEADPVTLGWRTLSDGARGRTFELPNSGGRRFLVGHGFGDYYRGTGYTGFGDSNPDPDNDPSPIYGYPLTDEFVLNWQGESVTCQVFERAVFEIRDGRVALRRLGALFLNTLPRPGIYPSDAWLG